MKGWEMENGKEENLRRLIRETAVEKTALDFTENVLRGIQAELLHENATELALKSLLQKHAVEKPSAAFQASIIEKLNTSQSLKVEPIITPKAWYAIAAMVAVLLLAAYIFPSDKSSEIPHFLTLASESVRHLTLPEISKSSLNIVVLSLLGLATLLLADYFMRLKASSYRKLARS